jgi:predicted GNAT family acetyltransferase
VVALTVADVPAMLDLAERTRPGPFFAETIALGGYVGVWRDGALAAMAGRRLRVPGWIEVSAVCTDPAFRGAGLGRRVTTAVMRGIRADGAEPFLHVLDANPARRLYEAMGFVRAGALHVTAAGVAA